jgi:hypothetical protein
MFDIDSIPPEQIPALLLKIAARMMAAHTCNRQDANNTSPTDELLDAKQLAAKLNVPKSWVAEQGRLGNIPVVKLGRYSRYRLADVEAAIVRHDGEPS